MVNQICLGLMGTNDKTDLGPRVKPLCEALAIMKIEGTQERMELLKKGEADKSWLNSLKGQFLVRHFKKLSGGIQWLKGSSEASLELYKIKHGILRHFLIVKSLDAEIDDPPYIK